MKEGNNIYERKKGREGKKKIEREINTEKEIDKY